MHLTSNPNPMLQNSAQQPPLRGEAGGGSIFDKIKEKVWLAITRKAVEVLVAMLTAAITALTTTSCMGYGPIG